METLGEVIQIALIQNNMKKKDLAEKLNCTTSNITNKLKRNKFSASFLYDIADAMDCDLEINFRKREETLLSRLESTITRSV